jgi:hypothetical protein
VARSPRHLREKNSSWLREKLPLLLPILPVVLTSGSLAMNYNELKTHKFVALFLNVLAITPSISV